MFLGVPRMVPVCDILANVLLWWQYSLWSVVGRWGPVNTEMIKDALPGSTKTTRAVKTAEAQVTRSAQQGKTAQRDFKIYVSECYAATSGASRIKSCVLGANKEQKFHTANASKPHGGHAC